LAEGEVPAGQDRRRSGAERLKLRVIKIGRIAYPEIRALAAIYEERLAPMGRVESVELKDDDALGRLLKPPKAEHPLIALDERGATWSSKEFANELRRRADDPGVKSLTFLVGGPLGLPDLARSEASALFSLSRATFTSDLAWLLLWEQLYRAHSILKGTAYHHE
jgi:23S rRNA (pseudouridine1915-N3)-methyltransferase